MPIIGCAGEGQAPFHKLLGNADAQRAMNASMIREAKENGCSGFQF
jgi:hypothetical protein